MKRSKVMVSQLGIIAFMMMNIGLQGCQQSKGADEERFEQKIEQLIEK